MWLSKVVDRERIRIENKSDRQPRSRLQWPHSKGAVPLAGEGIKQMSWGANACDISRLQGQSARPSKSWEPARFFGPKHHVNPCKLAAIVPYCSPRRDVNFGALIVSVEQFFMELWARELLESPIQAAFS
jgi:hypothetical protein